MSLGAVNGPYYFVKNTLAIRLPVLLVYIR